MTQPSEGYPAPSVNAAGMPSVPTGPAPGSAPPPAGHGFEFQIAASVVAGPTGPEVALHLQVGRVQTVLLMPADVAANLAGALPQVLAQAVAGARRAGLGLIIPDGVQLPPPNGGRG